jgi:hypothetical protein
MSVTTTQIGTNTWQVTSSGETTLLNMITAIDTVITNAGWSQVDVSNQYNRIYKALNADGTTYKYIGLTININDMKFSTTCYESWNASTHVGTNEAWTFNRAGQSGIQYSSCDVIIMANPRWLLFQSFIQNQQSTWHGVVELMRESYEDTAAAAYPCWAWVCSAAIFSQVGTPSVWPMISLPRTVGGLTGQAASLNNSLQTPVMHYGPAASYGSPISNLANMSVYGYDTTKNLMQSIRPVIGLNEVHGRVFGMKLTYGIGNPYNQVNINVDSNYNYSISGTSTPFWVLGAHPSTSTANVFTKTGLSTGTVQSGTATVTGCHWAVAVTPGYFIGTTAGVSYVDGTNPTSLIAPVSISGADTNVQGMVYDGRYVYGASATGVTRIDTLNSNAATTLTLATATSWLVYDGTYIWATQRTSSTNLSVYKITASTFTLTSTISLGNSSAYLIGDICSDVSGNVYVVTTAGLLYSITASNTVTQLAWTATVATPQIGVMFNGTNLVVAFYYNGSIYYCTVTTSGVSLAANQYMVMYTGPTATYPTLDITKCGVYELINSSASYGSSLIPTSVPNTNGVSYSSFYTNLSATFYSMWCDGNRAWSMDGSTFTLYSNLFHPDEGATANGRVLMVG